MLGHIALAIPSRRSVLRGLGADRRRHGLLKPNMCAMVGDLYPEGGARRDAGFSIFYTGINIGSFSGRRSYGLSRRGVGLHWGFWRPPSACSSASCSTRSATGTSGPPDASPTRADAAARECGRSGSTWLPLPSLIDCPRRSGTCSPPTAWQHDPAVRRQVPRLYRRRPRGASTSPTSSCGRPHRIEKKRVAVIVCALHLRRDLLERVRAGGLDQPQPLRAATSPTADRVASRCRRRAAERSIAFVILFAPVFAAIWVKLGAPATLGPTKFVIGLGLAGLGFAI